MEDNVKIVYQMNPECRSCSGYEEKIFPHQSPNRSIPYAINGMTYPSQTAKEIIEEIDQIVQTQPEKAAEQIFHHLRHKITKYVLYNEYNCERPLSLDLALWIEEKLHPRKKEMLLNFFKKFIS